MSKPLRRVGFIADNCAPGFRRGPGGWGSPLALLRGWQTGSSVAEMRFQWVAEVVNGKPWSLRYEWYRPWRHYDAVVFLKSMNDECCNLALRLRKQSVITVFDANVDYYTTASGRFYYKGMAPSPEQREQAIAMTQACNAVIADSEHIAKQCHSLNANVMWIPDNVNPLQIPKYRPWRPGAQPIPLLWCGEAAKLVDLLAIKNVLLKYAQHVRLVLVTNSLNALDTWFEGLREEFHDMLTKVSHTFINFRSLPDLFALYAEGGVIISPRFLDNPYNLGHTEWKITLGMACGRVAFCSPVSSYETVAARSGGQGIRVCANTDDWEKALDELLSGTIHPDEERAARTVVEKYYSTPVVAEQHAGLLEGLLAGCRITLNNDI